MRSTGDLLGLPLNLMIITSINLDFILLFFIFFLYSFLEILITNNMEDYRLIEIEEDLEDGEEFEEDDGDYHDEEFEENLIPQGIILPVNNDIIDELENDDDEDDVDFEDEYEDDDYEEEDEDDDYEDYEEDDYYEEEELEELIPVDMTSPRASTSISDGRNLNDLELRGVGDIDGLICPICFEAWTSSGEHQICCLPCGHIYGLYCIKKWLQQRRSSGKCPQCNNFCTLKDVRVLYVNGLCVADEELHKKVRLLEAKCAYLEQKVSRLTPEELIDQICSSPALVKGLAKALTEFHDSLAGQPLT